MPRNDSPNARAKLSEEAKVFNAKVEDFIKAVENEVYATPSDFNLIQFLGIKQNKLQYYKDNIDKHCYRAGFELLKMYREDFWTRKSLYKAAQTSAIFHLKQPMNGGYTDKQEKSNDPIKVEVVIKGCEGAFK